MPGTLTYSPAEIIAQLMQDLSLSEAASETTAWATFVGIEPPQPDKVITVFNTEPVAFGYTQTDGELQEQHGVLVRVRAALEPDAWTKANTIATTLDTSGADKTVIVSNTPYKLKTVSRSSGPISLGKPEGAAGKHSVYTINLLVSVRENS